MNTSSKILTGRIYTLSYEGKVVYVGFTTTSLSRRIYNHYALALSNQHTPIRKFLYEHQDDVAIELVEEFSYHYHENTGHAVGLELEKYWISQFSAWGFNLLNRTTTSAGRNESLEKQAPRSVFAYNLRTLRKYDCLTQSELASILGIKRSLLGAYEEARAEPSLNMFLKICEVFEVEDISGFLTNFIRPELLKAA